ncbi:MAG: 3-dehydroquinate synthase [Clostridia bacterium]|nr:3-dehydroquinate synthase [Clostridia bacterium]
MKRIKVQTGRPYFAVVTEGWQGLTGELEKVFSGEKIMCVTDGNTSRLFFDEVKTILGEKYAVSEFTIPAGESSKNTENYLSLICRLADERFSRGDLVLSLGGGVVGDLSGFAAATYMRGITFVQCPTTLLAAVDSSVGGKTAVDLPQGKNLIGAFYQPALVYINTDCLKTLPKSEVKCGMGEVVKYAFLSRSLTAELIKEQNAEELIAECLAIKSGVVSRDEFDHGGRALLNLGHTVGHATEVLYGYNSSHGECVAKGIRAIIDLSARFYGFGEQKKREMISLLALGDFDAKIGFSASELAEKILHDKKADGKVVNFVLIRDIGDCRTEKIPVDRVERLLSDCENIGV